jgi:hypothetical protein
MGSYRLRLREIRLSEREVADDVALFEVTREEDRHTWSVAAFLTPLFRVLHLRSRASVEARREMVADLGARAIVERLRQGLELDGQAFLVFTNDYPGAPGAPDPLLPYDQVIVRVDGVRPGSSLIQG